MMINKSDFKELYELIIAVGKEVELIKQKNIDVDYKDDSSPLSEADILVNERLSHFLKSKNYENIISEENKLVPYDKRRDWKYYWVIDPIDGTKEFIKKGNDYTINIALCQDNFPVFGIVYAPANKDMYHAFKNEGAFKNFKKISVNLNVNNKLNVVASKSHINNETEKFISNLKKKYEVNLLNIGSSLKLCLVAEGLADVYPRFGPTMEWDTCAAQIIVEEAGGKVEILSDKMLSYNKENLLNPYFVVSNYGLTQLKLNFDQSLGAHTQI